MVRQTLFETNWWLRALEAFLFESELGPKFPRYENNYAYAGSHNLQTGLLFQKK